MINNYYEFINESQIYNMLLESQVKFSNRFTNMLRSLEDNKIAKQLLSVENKDLAVQQNYIDVSDQKDSASFIPDRKAQEIKAKTPELWRQSQDTSRHLTHSSANDEMFAMLGYEKPEGDPWSPSRGTVGQILAEARSRKNPDNIYVIFQEEGGQGRKTVLNKAVLEPSPESQKLWTTYRSGIKVGRLARAILTAAGETFTAKDIEDFTNQYKAMFDFNSDALNKFEIVKGRDIVKWYKGENYVRGGGSLNNSCMANSKGEFFDIYSRNSQVSMVILYDDGGTLKDGKYTASKIKGRAILWEDAECTEVSKFQFMDRIYTVNDSDVELFKKFAESKGFWYKKAQSMDYDCTITNGSAEYSPKITVNLDHTNFDAYPYVDTMCFISTDVKKASNSEDTFDEFRKLRDTSGGYEDENDDYYSYDSYDDDDE